MNVLQAAEAILEKLRNNGYEALIVGGYVRDYLLGKSGSDIDIATSAQPDEIVQVFKRVFLTGLKHGTVTVVENKYQFEVTTYRLDTGYADFRHPDHVRFVRTFKEDVKRRDFTMNALGLYNQEVIDYVGGQADIKNKLIRTVGNASERIQEDALRILRAFRFVSQLGFQLDQTLILAIKAEGQLIANISEERIIAEFTKMIEGDYLALAIQFMIETNFHSHLPFYKRGIEAVAQAKFIPNNMIEFFVVMASNGSREAFNQLPIANYLKKDVHIILDMLEIGITDFSRILLFRHGLENCLSVNHINHCFNNTPDQRELIIAAYQAMPITKQCDLVFKGDQIIALFDRTPGAWISDILEAICLKVLLGEIKNESDEIRQFVLNNF